MGYALLLYVAAAIFFALAAIGATAGRFSFLAAGLFCWVLVPLIITFSAVT